MSDLFSVEIVGFAEGECEAIVAMQPLDWDLALVDLFLKQGSGLGVARAFKSREPPRRLFVVTNYATADMRTRCAEVGVDALFDKSVELDALFEAEASWRALSPDRTPRGGTWPSASNALSAPSGSFSSSPRARSPMTTLVWRSGLASVSAWLPLQFAFGLYARGGIAGERQREVIA